MTTRDRLIAQDGQNNARKYVAMVEAAALAPLDKSFVVDFVIQFFHQLGRGTMPQFRFLGGFLPIFAGDMIAAGNKTESEATYNGWFDGVRYTALIDAAPGMSAEEKTETLTFLMNMTRTLLDGGIIHSNATYDLLGRLLDIIGTDMAGLEDRVDAQMTHFEA